MSSAVSAPPQPISKLVRERQKGGKKPPPSMEEAMPEGFRRTQGDRRPAGGHHRDMQDVEFTVQEGKLYRRCGPAPGKRTAEAALKIAIDMEGEGLIDRENRAARGSIPPRWTSCCIPCSIPTRRAGKIAAGLGASPGAATEGVGFSAEEAGEASPTGQGRHPGAGGNQPSRTVHGMHAAKRHPRRAARGGMTSHARAVVRAHGPALCGPGAGGIKIDTAAGEMLGGHGVTGEAAATSSPSTAPPGRSSWDAGEDRASRN